MAVLALAVDFFSFSLSGVAGLPTVEMRREDDTNSRNSRPGDAMTANTQHDKHKNVDYLFNTQHICSGIKAVDSFHFMSLIIQE